MNGKWNDFMLQQNVPFSLKEISYGEYPDQKIYFSLPQNTNSFPVIVWYHGGGMVGGERDLPDELLNGKYGIAEVRYRVSNGQFNSVDSIEDAVRALAWTMEHAAGLGGDPSKIFVGGISAGAYLAAMAGMAPHLLGKYGHDHRKIAGLILVSGQMSTHYQLKTDLGYPHRMWHPVIDEYAPIYYASADLPPVIFVTGDFGCDMPTRAEENAYFASVLRALGHKDARHYSLGGHDHCGVSRNSGWLYVQFIDRLLKSLCSAETQPPPTGERPSS